jgi:hypothetical protein
MALSIRHVGQAELTARRRRVRRRRGEEWQSVRWAVTTLTTLMCREAEIPSMKVEGLFRSCPLLKVAEIERETRE